MAEQRFSHATVSCRGGNDKQSSHALQRRHDPRNTHREATGRQKRGWTQSGGGLLAYKRAFTRASGERTEIQISHKYETNTSHIKDKFNINTKRVSDLLAQRCKKQIDKHTRKFGPTKNAPGTHELDTISKPRRTVKHHIHKFILLITRSLWSLQPSKFQFTLSLGRSGRERLRDKLFHLFDGQKNALVLVETNIQSQLLPFEFRKVKHFCPHT